MAPTLTLRPPLDPFREFGQLFQGLVGRPWFGEALGTTGGQPALNVWETEEGYVLEAELPGMTLEDVELTMLDNVLTLAGTHREVSAEGVSYRRRERRLGSFKREVRLPSRVDANAVSATLSDGVLTVSVPKAEETRPRKIEVKLR
ncbi:MAG: Hsp20/alpha crystallin family protein [Planctomycetota bacterium]